MKYGVMLAAGSLLLAGCASREPEPSPELKLLSEEVAALRESLEKIDGKLDRVLKAQRTFPQREGERRFDPEKIRKIKPLPENPSDEQIRAYVDEIAEASRGQRIFGSTDPQVGLLRAIGPGHLEVLIPYMGQEIAFYLRSALPSLVQESDKELVLKNLIAGRDLLLEVVARRQWAGEARPRIIEMLKNGQGNQFWGSMDQIISQIARTPEEREELADIFITYPNTSPMIPGISCFPEIDQAEVSRKAWESHRFDENYSRRRYAMYAAQHGCREALEELLTLLIGHPELMRNDSAGKQQLSELLGRPYDPAAMRNYVTANKEKLAFDREKMKYVLKEKQ